MQERDAVDGAVRTQYETYSYPTPVKDLAKNRLLADPTTAAIQLWPNGRTGRPLKILSAGCGTHQAALLAYHNPDASVLGVDISAASLAHEELLAREHGVRNLELKQLDLLEIASLGRQFDYIACTGVLHHMHDPDAGLRALRHVTAPDGRLYLMLYARAARAGLYLIQDAFRRMGLGQSADDVALARDTFRACRNDHHVVSYVRRSQDELKNDVAFVDSFMHPRDRAYSVPELMKMLGDSGLKFAGWLESGHYYPDAFVSGAVLNRIRELPETEQWAVIEDLMMPTIKHDFFAARADDAEQAIGFSGNDWVEFIPHYAPGAASTGSSPETWQIARLGIVTKLSQFEALVVSQVNGKRTIAEILKHPLLAKNQSGQLLAAGRALFGRLWRLGHLVYQRVSSGEGKDQPSP
jgi:SAM-dependent methyltransferase